MNYNITYYRKKHNIDLSLPPNYRNVWQERMPMVRELLTTMSIRQIAQHYGTTVHAVTGALRTYDVSANDVRYRHKLKLNEQ